MSQPTITLDQKLKAIEIAVSLFGPLKMADDSTKNIDAANAASADLFQDYLNFAALILEAANNMAAKSP